MNAYGRAAVMAALAVCVSGDLLAAGNGTITDAEALAIVQRHCVACHAVKPAHPAFDKPPNGVTLETLADLKTYASRIYAQTVQNRAMPLGNQTHMSDEERAALGRWLQALP
ncbi:MAG TPA: c-type cytochrome [Pseudolabrys sp.]|nr:c-type cytochrome [Pseudolabrys sp.]